MVVITEEAKWELLSDELWQKGYIYFRWGGFAPWEFDLPSKGDLSVISIQLILMNCDKLNDSIQINKF